MLFSILGKRKRADAHKHPYLSGNFAPIHTTCPLTPCQYTGTIPEEFHGGQYVRNGGNPVSNEDLGRDAHWFDGDGMLAGVSFRRSSRNGGVEPEFVNQFILTDLLLHTLSTRSLRKPILPSIATLVSPFSTLLQIVWASIRAVILVMLSKLPGSHKNIEKISVANTSIMYHDGRALATCESGPPMRVQLPSLDTIGWYNGIEAQGEPASGKKGEVFGGEGIMSFMKEWTTAHPKVDPKTNEMILFHSTFAPPFVHYSIIPADRQANEDVSIPPRMLNAPVAGISSAKMIHDFGVAHHHTVMMDLPLSLDPLQLAKNEAPISYDVSKPSRFGVYPRREPWNVRWFETSACCIFHTANTWDVLDEAGIVESVDMLTCRQTSAAVVFSAGNVMAPPAKGQRPKQIFEEKALGAEGFEDASLLESPSPTSYADSDAEEEDQCRLYYYSFSMKDKQSNKIAHQWALSTISYEFPSVSPSKEMSSARYVYGCTTVSGSFNTALGRAAKIDGLVKFDVHKLIALGKSQPPTSITGSVDTRSVDEILTANERTRNSGAKDTIQIFRTPPNMYAQEPRFVPSANGKDEDDGFLVSYMFDETQLDKETGEPTTDAISELWIIDAKNMADVIAKIKLPQRVPYGLHGSWFSERQVLGQRSFDGVRTKKTQKELQDEMLSWSLTQKLGREVRECIIRLIGG